MIHFTNSESEHKSHQPEKDRFISTYLKKKSLNFESENSNNTFQQHKKRRIVYQPENKFASHLSGLELLGNISDWIEDF